MPKLNKEKIKLRFERENILNKIHHSALKFLVPLSSKDAYALITQEAKRLIEVEHSSIFLFEKNELKRVYATTSFLFKIKLKKTGFVYKTFNTKTIYIVDVEKTKNVRPEIKRAKIKTIIIIPLIYLKKIIGVLALYSYKTRSFTGEEVEAFKLFGSMASLIIKKAQSNESMEKVIKEKEMYRNLESILERIYSSSIKFLEPLETKETYHIITKEAIKLVNADYGSLILEEKEILKRVYSTMPIKLNPRKKGNTYKTFKEKKAFFIHNLKSKRHKRAYPEVVKLGIQSIIYIPLVYKKKSIGVLVLNSKNEEYFTKKELKMLLLFGSLASMAIKNNQLYKETREALDLRDRFISLASHEFRTPLTTLNGYAQLLNKKFAEKNTVEAQWIRNINSEIARLTNLIKGLLQVNRIKSGQLQFILSECNIIDVVKQAINNFHFNYPERKIVLDNIVVDGGDKVIGDCEKLSQVFTNILDNAAKFSPRQSTIFIELKTNFSDVIVSIKDEGKGINKEDLKKIFEGFYKGRNTNEERGMGFGLYLAQNILKELRGVITVNSIPGKGTKVEIKLPKTRYDTPRQ